MDAEEVINQQDWTPTTIRVEVMAYDSGPMRVRLRGQTGDGWHLPTLEKEFLRDAILDPTENPGQACCCEFDTDGELREPCVYHAQVIAQVEECNQRCRRAAQRLIEAAGAPGPEGIEETAERVASELDAARAEIARLRGFVQAAYKDGQACPGIPWEQTGWVGEMMDQ